MKKNYLVTGGAGFIGSHICERLVRNGQVVRVLDNFSTGKEENLASFQGAVDVVRGDIRDRDVVHDAMRDIDVVFHQAALGSVPRSVEDPLTTHDVNVTGTLNVLHAARDANVQRLVYASSSSVYGETVELPKHEAMVPQPLSPYALSKLTGEYYIKVFKRVYGFEAVALRYFNIFGPRQDPQSHYAAVIPKFATALLNGQSPTIYGDGLQSRDFTYVENAVHANLLASEAEGVAGRVFNIGCNARYTLLDILERMRAYIGSDVAPIHGPARTGDVRDSQASIEAAREALGYGVQYDFDEGLRRTVEWYQRCLMRQSVGA